MNTAKEIARVRGWKGDARVYELNPPMTYRDPYSDDEEDPTEQTSLVIVSAVDVAYSGPETYIFPAKRSGDAFKATDMLELDGSFRGALDHVAALNNAGYEVIP